MEIVICSAKRTAIGSFGGSLKDISAVELGTAVVRDLLKESGISAEQVDEVIFGNVLGAGLGQNVARQIAMHSGIPEDKTAFTVDMVCGSGLRAIQLAAQSILTGQNQVVVAGGTESMSQAPYLAKKQRWGSKLGHASLEDSILTDGLTDVFSNQHMGLTAENIAERYQITRQAQDAYAAESQRRALAALESDRFASEITPVLIPQRRGEPVVFDQDEYPRETSEEKLAALRPAFKPEGTVTAGNASGINDGAAAVILTSRELAESHDWPILCSIVSQANAGVSPDIMGTGPIPASQKVLQLANLTLEEIDLVEANEAFAAQALCVVQELGLDPMKTNVNGGAIALGHPIGASGARILVSLIYELRRRQAQYGLATLCIGGGQGTALIIRNHP
ncbi:acetyl-CoA C-acetyltransferase [Falseniella ignava]|uniref:acetyl-CoA C-acetyltransferase n=1 Tax=Falseniella ignava CCUG 37419 TaxID=883112 RepID=K1LYS1_9LACT|nr:acetyl-CoA C-acetyltransferase [Falseniella ignava]EKB55203.1 acetyl-CoA C-acetyltransferase [Falseniella ignava CCUG 37419]